VPPLLCLEVPTNKVIIGLLLAAGILLTLNEVEEVRNLPPSPTDLTQVLIAEYAALRSEIAGRIAAQDAMINLFMTATAAIIGFALADRARLMLLLIVPVLAFAVRLLYQYHNIHIGLLSEYINVRLRPLAIEASGHPDVLGWEQGYARRIARTQRLRLPQGGALFALFPLSTALALILVIPALQPWWAWGPWTAGILLLIGQVLVPRFVRKPSAVEATPAIP
jgi:hypothetical protein